MTSKTLILISLALIFMAVSLRAIAHTYEPRILFHPHIALEINPKVMGLDYKEVAIPSGRYKLHGWFFPGKSDVYVIFFHGNAGNMADRLDFARFLEPLGFNLLMFDYRGYGRSEGIPTIGGIETDAVSVVDWAVKEWGVEKRIVLWGRSLGGAASLLATLRRPDIGGVIVESSFVSLRAIAMDAFPWMPVVFVSNAFPNATIMENLPTPKLILHGMNDTLIPIAHSEELYRRAAEPKKFVPIKGAGHSDTYIRGGREYLKVVGEWITERTR